MIFLDISTTKMIQGKVGGVTIQSSYQIIFIYMLRQVYLVYVPHFSQQFIEKMAVGLVNRVWV